MGDEGYFKVWRKLWRWPVFRAMSWDQRGVVFTLLRDANWREDQVLDKATGLFVMVERGALLTTERGLAEAAEVGRRVVRTSLRMLESDPGDGPFLTREPTQGKTLITISNYRKYQDVQEGPDPASDPSPTQHPTQARPKPDPASLYKKVKKVKQQQQPVLVECLQCNQQWRLIPGKNGRDSFYGHGKLGSATGCRATCPADEYQQRKEASEQTWGDDDF